MPTLPLRRQIIREIRSFVPDLVLTHRTADYHPDHRAVGQVVQDAMYMVTVPLIVPDVPILRRNPVLAYMTDLFTRPSPLEADVVLDVDAHVDTIVAMLACHRSQVFEFLPYNQGVPEQVPSHPPEQLAWLRQWYGRQAGPRADRFRRELVEAYGAEKGRLIEFAEAYEISQYGAPLDPSARDRLFPRMP